MIPKVIHYCWFGGKKKSKLILDCILSWKENMPDYEIIEWNETNSDLSHPFVKAAYRLKKGAFVSDFIRFKVLFENGGIYLDTDMMVIKPIDNLLENECFFGIEDKDFISAGIIGTIQRHDFIKKCFDSFDNIKIDSTTDFNLIALPLIITSCFRNHYKFRSSFDEFKKTLGIKIYPISFFYPLPNNKKYDIKNFKSYIEESTFAVHLWNASWVEYNEFDYIKNRKYNKAFYQIFCSVFFENKLNLFYLKRVVRSFLNVIKNKK